MDTRSFRCVSNPHPQIRYSAGPNVPERTCHRELHGSWTNSSRIQYSPEGSEIQRKELRNALEVECYSKASSAAFILFAATIEQSPFTCSISASSARLTLAGRFTDRPYSAGSAPCDSIRF